MDFDIDYVEPEGSSPQKRMRVMLKESRALRRMHGVRDPTEEGNPERAPDHFEGAGPLSPGVRISSFTRGTGFPHGLMTFRHSRLKGGMEGCLIQELVSRGTGDVRTTHHVSSPLHYPTGGLGIPPYRALKPARTISPLLPSPTVVMRVGRRSLVRALWADASPPNHQQSPISTQGRAPHQHHTLHWPL